MFKKMREVKHAVHCAVAGMITALVASPAHAALDLTGVSFDLTNYESIAVLIITAFAGIWAIKRVMGLVVR